MRDGAGDPVARVRAFREGRLALVLSGGGARGAFDAGVAHAVEDRGLTPTILAGTSAGGLTAAALAVGWSARRVADFWRSLESRDVYRPRLDLHRLLRPDRIVRDPRHYLGFGEHTATETLLDTLGWTWTFHLSPLRERMVRELGGVRLRIRDGITLSVSAVEIGSGRLVRFTNRELPPGREREEVRVVEMTVDHLLASAAIPGLFQPVEIDGSSFWDGGLASNTPLTAALEHDPDAAIVVASSARDAQPRPPTSFGDVLALAVEHVFRSALMNDLDHARTVNELVGLAPEQTKHRVVELLAVMPASLVTGIGQILDFEPRRAARFVADGRESAHTALRELDDEPS